MLNWMSKSFNLSSTAKHNEQTENRHKLEGEQKNRGIVEWTNR